MSLAEFKAVLDPHLGASLSRLGVRPAGEQDSGRATAVSYLKSGQPRLDAFLGGGLAVGSLVEWGVPLGLGGRYVILAFVAAATRPQLEQPAWASLWVYPPSQLNIYPPAWQAYGVDLRQLAFARTESPVRELKPVFLDPSFKLIVLDMPQRLSRDDCAFIARQARSLDKLIIVLHNRLLSAGQGNVWAKLRLNCQRDPRSHQHLQLSAVRGLPPQAISLRLSGGHP